MEALYFLLLSICIAGGAENCLGAALDTGPPCAAAEAAADGEAAGLGSGLDALLATCAADGGDAGARVAVGAAAGEAFWPQPASTSSAPTTLTSGKNRFNFRSTPERQVTASRGGLHNAGLAADSCAMVFNPNTASRSSSTARATYD
jgi:hypothetical protein